MGSGSFQIFYFGGFEKGAAFCFYFLFVTFMVITFGAHVQEFLRDT